MSKINIQFTLFSAFYTPLIVTMAGGFLQREGRTVSAIPPDSRTFSGCVRLATPEGLR